MVKIITWLTLVLAAFGLVMISSAGIFLSQKNFGSNYYYFQHQLLYGFLPGLLFFWAALKIDNKKWKGLALPFILVSICLLLLVFVPGLGVSVGGAKRWLDIGFFSFQPSEILKLGLIIYLASWFSAVSNRVKEKFSSVLAFLVVLFFISVFLVAQPDVGTLGIIVAIALAMFFASGIEWKHLFGIILVIILSFALIVVFSPYRFSRLFVFLNPDFDVRGVGYHLNQSLIAIGKGGLFGLGFGQSEQKLGFLPEPVSDSIFAVIGEELGFVGMAAAAGLLLALVIFSFLVAKRTKDRFASLFAVGFGSWVGIQSFVNIAALSGLAPLTGIPLPFISYGGTALAVLMAGAGVLGNIAKKV